MKDRIKDIIATLGQLQSFVLDIAVYETIIIYVKCNVSISDEQFLVTFKWYGRELVITPYFVSYGQGGYDIEDTSLRTYLEFDFDIQPKFKVFDKNDHIVYSEKY